MQRSSPILPLPIYDDFFDQQRFNFHSHNSQQMELFYPSNDMPLFQFSRSKKYEMPDKFYLRNTCSDLEANFYKLFSEPASIFSTFAATDIYGSFPKKNVTGYSPAERPIYGTQNLLDISCGQLISIGTGNCTPVNGILEIPISGGGKLRGKIIVDKLFFSPGTTLQIRLVNGTFSGPTIVTLNGPGTFFFDFTPLEGGIKLEINNFKCDDEFAISYMQFYWVNPKEQASYTSDVILDPGLLKVVPMKDGTDQVVYCNNNFTNIVPPGEYYYVIGSGNDFYFSETFRVISFREAEKYYRLKWWNDCDINNSVLYRFGLFFCFFTNTLYLDAALFNPEPETKEDGTANGLDDLTPTFSSWKKNINLEIGKCPEFLTDSLSAIFMHNNVYLRKPLNDKQEGIPVDVKIKRVIPEVTNVLQDYFQKVNLKLLLQDLFTKTGCCTEAEILSCTPCQYTATSAECAGTGYQLILSGPPELGDGLKDCKTGYLVELKDDELICFEGKYYSLVKIDGVWNVRYIAPSAEWTSDVSPGKHRLEGYGIPHSFAVVEYNLNGGGWTVANNAPIGADGIIEIVLDTTGFGVITDLKARVRSRTLTCDYGTSSIIEIV